MSVSPASLNDHAACRDARGVPVRLSVDLLRRYLHLERRAMHALAGWFLRVPAYETKIAMGHQLWAHAERADAVYQRLHEMRGGHGEANTEPALARLTEALRDAPGPEAFLAGHRWLLDQLERAYRDHHAATDPTANAAERRLMRYLAAEVHEAKTGERAIGAQNEDRAGQSNDEPSRAWAAHLDALLAAAGGVTGVLPRAEPPRETKRVRFERGGTLVFDERIQCGTFEPYEQRLEHDFQQRRVAEMEIFFNEFYAAALLASILDDARDAHAPWAFFHDMAHHFWDEVRHAEFGRVRLTELGHAPSRVDLRLFEHAQRMPFLHRLCYLTLGLEVFFMPRKRPRVKRYEQAGDPRTQLFADVDWSDEGNHVQYGKRWVHHFLQDDARTVEELQEEIDAHLRALKQDLPAGQLAPY